MSIDFSGAEPRWRWGAQGAGGSTSIPDGWAELRQFGAQGRWLMRQAAPRAGASRADVKTEAGHALHPDGRRLAYGELVAAAAELALPAEPVPLKEPPSTASSAAAPRRRRGGHRHRPRALRHRRPRTGCAHGRDAALPVLRRRHRELDDSAARAVPGVRAVLVIPGPKPGEPITANLATGVAVVADDTWSALKGRAALKVKWTRGPFADESSAALDAPVRGAAREARPDRARRRRLRRRDARRRQGRPGALPPPVREPRAARAALRVRARAGRPGARDRGPAAAGRRVARGAHGDGHPARRRSASR